MNYRLRFLQAPTGTGPWFGTWIDEPLSFVRRPPVHLEADSLNGLRVAATARGLPTDGLPTDGLPTDKLPTDQLPADGLPMNDPGRQAVDRDFRSAGSPGHLAAA